MTYAFDAIIIFIFLFFSIKGMLKGFLQQSLEIIGIVAGIYFAYKYGAFAGSFLKSLIQEAYIRDAVASLLIFFGVLLIIFFVHKFISHAFRAFPIGWINNVLGLFIGALQGLVITTIIFVIISTFSSNSKFVLNSKLSVYLKKIASLAVSFVDTENETNFLDNA